jgi:aspartyl-tRNA(Asn)/glutamyl-tRNA(Gln) amidotransferase subunit A
MTDPTIFDLGAALRAGETSALELTQAALARASDNAPLHAFADLFEKTAISQAITTDAALAMGQDLGPLMGIPIGIKDMIDIAGRPTRAASRVPASPALTDAACVARLRTAGAIILGATQTYEFATVGPDESLAQPPARNPWNPDRITGGSSSGSAVAVAAGIVRVALGTDTGGSIRSPSAYCGVVGLKPTKGRVPNDGVLPLSPSLDHTGPIAATVAEAALVLDTLSNPGRKAASGSLTAGAAGLRIGYPRHWIADDPATDPAVLKALDDAASALSLAGASIRLVTLPDYDMFETAGALILDAEAFGCHRDRIREHAAHYGVPALRSLLRGMGLNRDDIANAWEAAQILGARLDETLSQVDLLLTATTLAPAPPVAAFRGGRAVWTAMRTLPFNLSGHPALSLPCGLTDGLPIGMQLIAAKGAEDILCRAGHAFEDATDHSLQRPARALP